jgi:hypothetical protein
VAQEHHAPSFSILREIRRRPRVVGAFPDGQSAFNLCCGQAACCVSCERAFRGESGARLDTQGLAVTRLIRACSFSTNGFGTASTKLSAAVSSEFQPSPARLSRASPLVHRRHRSDATQLYRSRRAGCAALIL